MDPLPHGGRLIQARVRYPGAPEPFIDLSTGVSPFSYAFTLPRPEAWARLPEPEALAGLERVAARAYGVADPASVVAAPGTQALIQLLPRLLPQARIAVPGPTYAEHAAGWVGAGSELVPLEGARAAVLCNPNNPDGVRRDPAALVAMAEGMELLVIDEAFADFEPGVSAAPALPRPGLVILRSFGKSYGLAGLRLGFALAEPGLAARIRGAVGPWPISGPAIAIGTQALADDAWRDRARARAHEAAGRLDALLRGGGLQLLGGTALFRLAGVPDALGVAHRLGRAGILVRVFDEHPGWIRFGLPGDERAWARLAAAICKS